MSTETRERPAWRQGIVDRMDEVPMLLQEALDWTIRLNCFRAAMSAK